MHNPVLIKSFEAGSDIGGHHFVVVQADGTVAQASDGSKPILGVIDRTGASSGQTVDVVLLGVAEVEAAGAISAGTEVTVNEHGQAVTVSATAASGSETQSQDESGTAQGASATSVAVGLAVSTTTSAGEYVSVLLR